MGNFLANTFKRNMNGNWKDLRICPAFFWLNVLEEARLIGLRAHLKEQGAGKAGLVVQSILVGTARSQSG